MNLKIKTIVLIAAMGIISYPVIAQKMTSVPQSAIDDFSSKYNQAQLKNWKTENNEYIASFVMNNRKWQAYYDNNGHWVETERTIRHIKNLASDIRKSLRNSQFASYHIDEVRLIQTPSKTIYSLEVDNNSGNKMLYDNIGSFDDELLYFSPKGELIKTVNNSDE